MTPYDLAQRYIGIAELSGEKNHPLVQWWLSLCGFSLETPDSTPWCSAFVNGMAWELRLGRSKSAAARSWLSVGTPVDLKDARPGYDVVILERGTGVQPGPSTTHAPGHVGFYAGVADGMVHVLGGNQGDQVSVAAFAVTRVLGIRRLA